MPKVLIATGDAAESLEVMYPYQRLLEELADKITTAFGAPARRDHRDVTVGSGEGAELRQNGLRLVEGV